MVPFLRLFVVVLCVFFCILFSHLFFCSSLLTLAIVVVVIVATCYDGFGRKNYINRQLKKHVPEAANRLQRYGVNGLLLPLIRRIITSLITSLLVVFNIVFRMLSHSIVYCCV